MRFIVILFLLFTSICTLTQQSDSQLAYIYCQTKEYDKAAEKFLKLYERTVIEKTLKSLCQQTDYLPVFDELTVWYNLQIRNHSQALQHAVLSNNKSENKLHIFQNIALDAVNNKAFDQVSLSCRRPSVWAKALPGSENRSKNRGK